MTSPSYGSLLPGIGTLIADANDEVQYCDQDNKGFIVLTLTPDHATADFRTVSTVMTKSFAQATATRFRASAARPEAKLEQLA